VKLLEIQSSANGESSNSIALSKPFIEAGQSHNTSVPDTTDRGILMFDKGDGPDLRNQLERCAQGRLIEVERMSAIGMMSCSISHDMRHLLSAIHANAELLESHDRSSNTRADLLLEIQEAVLAMTERIDSLLQFGSSGRKVPLIPQSISLILEKAVAAEVSSGRAERAHHRRQVSAGRSRYRSEES
jgi:signal transduction histidine kinase